MNKLAIYALTVAILGSSVVGVAFAQSFSIGPMQQQSPTGATYNASAKSYKSGAEACSDAKSRGGDHAQKVKAIDFTFGGCDCSSRNLEGFELSAQQLQQYGRTSISEHTCNVDVRVTFK